jgi:two-component system, NtrC family, nitrogen regulation sensor histidine kinase NtrY
VSVRTKLLLLVALSIPASVGAVAWLIEERAHEAFRLVEQERTAGLVHQFQREFDHEGEEITRAVESIANSDSMLRTVIELQTGGEYANHVNEAAGYAAAQRLDFLDLIAPDGTIISSAHWPARFGYKQRWFLDAAQHGVEPRPQQAFLKHLETAQGSELALVCLRTVRTQGVSYYLIGGRRLDRILQSLTPPEGLRVSIDSIPEQGPAEILSASKATFDAAKLQPLIQKAVDQHGEASATINWGPDGLQEEIVHAVALRGYTDRVPAVLLVGNSLDQETALEKNIRNVSLLIAGLGVLVGVIGSGIVATRISSPIKRLADATAKIGQGDWDVAVEPGSRDEIGKLAVAFNQMTHELIEQRERLVQSERVAAWRELARRLAHELKNPLFPLQITVENLLRARENTPEQFDEVFRESTATLLAEITNLKTIIGRFSDFSKMPAPQFQEVNLEEMIRSVVQLFQGQLTHGPAAINTDLRLDGVPPVKGDPVLLRRVIENLVLNAIDAMPQGGMLTFRTELNQQSVAFEISDTGQGLTKEECERLFTPYYTTKQHGTGLGLAIVQSVVSDHHGKISVSSTKNFGTTFRIELPAWSGASIEGAGNTNDASEATTG